MNAIASGTAVASTRAVTKSYGKSQALHGITLDIPAGVTAILGPNGAGKSTLIDIVSGLRRPDTGTATVLGGHPQEARIRARIGLTSQATGLPMRLTVRETLDLVAAHYSSPAPRERLVADLDLANLLGKRNGTLSGGQRRRVAIAVALVGAPDFLILDEPSTGLDLESRERLWAAVRGFRADGTSVLLSTHYLEEAEALADHVVLLADGEVAREGSVEQVCAAIGIDVVEIEVADGRGLAALPLVDHVDEVGRRHRLFTRDADGLVRELVRNEIAFTGLTVSRAGLSDAIRALSAPPEPRVLLEVGA